MEWLAYLIASVFALIGLGCVALTAIGLPGTWILLVLALALELLDVFYLDAPTTFGWWVLITCLGLALLGELLEAVTGAVGTRVGGGTKRGMIGAVVGGIVGAIALTPIIPIPVLGTLIGALFGTFCGAYFAERSAPLPPEPLVPPPEEEAEPGPATPGSTPPNHLKAAAGATVGRLLGTVAKAGLALVIWITLSVAAFWR